MAHHFAPRVRPVGTHPQLVHRSRAAMTRRGRIRWRALCMLALLAAAFIGGIYYGGGRLFFGPRYEASAWLQLRMTPPGVIQDAAVDIEEFNTFKRTQAALLASPPVLGDALRDPAVADLPSIAGNDDALADLARHVQVSFPGDGALVRVSLAGHAQEDVTKTVDAIVQAYLRRVVEKERNAQQRRFTMLQDLLRTNRAEIKQMQEKLEQLAQDTGSPDSEVVKRKIERMERDLVSTQEEVIVAERHANDLEMQVALSAAKLKQAQEEEPVVTESMVEDYLRPKENFQNVFGKLRQLQQTYDERVSRTPGGPESIAQEKQRERIEAIQEELSQLRQQARAELLIAIKQERIIETTTQLSRYRTEAELRNQHVKRVQTRLEKLNAETQKLSKRSFDLAQKQSELAQLQDVTMRVAAEYERLKIELGAPPRVELLAGASAQQRGWITRAVANAVPAENP